MDPVPRLKSCADFFRGKLVMDRGKGKPKMKCKNWECGVVVPVFATGRTLSEKASERTEPLGMEVFKGVVPVPMQVPAESIKTEGRTPWYHNEVEQIMKKERKGRIVRRHF